MIESEGLTRQDVLVGGAAESERAAGQSSDSERARTPRLKTIGRLLAVAIPVLIWVAPLGLDPPAQRALAIASFMIISWMTEAMAHALTGFVGCYLFWALGVVKFNVAFGGFAAESPWFCFGALLLGMTATKTGLARRLTHMVISRVGDTHSRLFLGFTLVSLLLTFLVPSGSARVIILAAIALGVMQARGLGPGSSLGRGVFVIISYSAGLFDKMLIAGAGTILARDLIQKHGHVTVSWSRWSAAFLPCLLLTIFVIWRLALWLFPPEGAAGAAGTPFLTDEVRHAGKWSVGEKKAALLMSVAVALWATDFLHHLSPAMIGLGAGLFAALPRLGVLGGEDVKRLNYLPVFFVATALTMGDVLIQTKAIDTLTGVMFAWMEPLMAGAHTRVVVPFWASVIYHIFLGSNISMLSTSLPPLMTFAAAHGLDPLPLGMVWTFGGGPKFFMYQSTVLIVGYSYGYFSGRDLLRFAAWMSVIEFLMLLLLAVYYWPLIGLV
jgi:anion transporter